MSKFIIYILHHDASDCVYVGKSSKGVNRAREHGFVSNRKKNAHLPVVCWIEKYENYSYSVLEECSSSDDLNEAERFHIAYLRSVGAKLLNCTDGGDGQSPGFTPWAAIVAGIAARTGRPLAPQHAANVAAARKTPEARAKTAIASTGRIFSWESRQKKSATLRARGHQPSLAAHIAAKLSNQRRKGERRDPAAVAKTAAANQGSKRTLEQRERMCAAQRLLAQKRKRSQVPRIRINLLPGEV